MKSYNDVIIIDVENNQVNVLQELKSNSLGIKSIDLSVSDINNRLDTFDTYFDAVDGQLTSLAKACNDNKANVDIINSDIEILTNSVNDINDDISDINSNINTLLKKDFSNIDENKLIELNNLNLVDYIGQEVQYIDDFIQVESDGQIIAGVLSDVNNSAIGIALTDADDNIINSPNIITKLNPIEISIQKYTSDITGSFYSLDDSLEIGTNCYSDINLTNLIGVICYKVGSIFKVNKGLQTFVFESKSDLLISSCYQISGDLINGYCVNNQLNPGDIIYEDQLMTNKLYDILSYDSDSNVLVVINSDSSQLEDNISIGEKIDNKEPVYKYNFSLDGPLYSKDSLLSKDSKLYQDQECSDLFGIINSIQDDNRGDIIPNSGEIVNNQEIETRIDYERIIDSDFNGVIDYKMANREYEPLYVKAFIPKNYKFKIIIKDCNNTPKIYKYLLNKII